MSSLSTFDDDLRRALSSRAANAPLPPETLHVPKSWVSEGRSPLGLLGRSLAYAMVAVAALIVVAQASALLDRTGGDSIGSVADRLGLPERQVLQTQDGYLAVRFNPSRIEAVDLLMVSPDGNPQVLATGLLNPRARASEVISLGTFPVSCTAGSGLSQPNAIFGYAHMAGAPVDQIRLDLSAESTFSEGLFLFVLDSGATPADVVKLTAQSSQRPDVGGWSDITPDEFANSDACRGEAIQPMP